MRAPAVSFARRFAAAALVALLMFALLPAAAFAEGEGDSPSTEESQEDNSVQAEEEAGSSPRRVVASSQGLEAPLALPDLGSTPAASSAEGGTLAASLMGRPTSFVNADVILDGEPVVGSFTVEGLTFAVTEGANVRLVGVAALEADDSIIVLPESVAYNDAEYFVASIGAYAFYLSGVASVELPAGIAEVDERAFRSSDVALVTVAEGNSAYSSFDGALYSADQLSLLLIPEGKQGTVLLPKTAESAAPSVFSHCPLVTQISVEEGSAAFASENGLLYDASLTTLLRVPAGATDITIHEGCTTIAAGAMEGCAKLVSITAPTTVASISPDVFTSVPTVSLPAASIADDEAEGKVSNPVNTQLTALVAFSSTDDDLPEVDLSRIVVLLAPEASSSPWQAAGFFDMEGHRLSNEAFSEVGAELRRAAAYATGGWGIISPSSTVYFQEMQSETWRPGSSWDMVAHTPFFVSYTAVGQLAQLGLIGDSFLVIRNAEGTSKLRMGLNSSYGGINKLEYTWDFKTYNSLLSNHYYYWNELAGSDRIIYFAINGARPCWNVDFDLAGGTSGRPVSFKIAYGEKPPTINTGAPVRAGYAFDGWWDESLNKKYYDAYGEPTIAAWDQVEDVTLVAHWRDTGHLLMMSDEGELHYRINAGSWTTIGCSHAGCDFATTSSVKAWIANGQAFFENHGSVLAFSYGEPGANDITKLEYTLDYKTYIPLTATSQATAQTVSWENKAIFCLNGSRPKWAVSFELAGGVSDKTPTVYAVYGEAMPGIWGTHTLPTKLGYTFMGWYAPNGVMFYDDLLRVQARFPYLESIVLTARWSLSSYDVRYELDGGVASGNPGTYDMTTETFTLRNPVKRGYVFAGWSGTELEGSGNMEVTVPKGSTGNRTYTAHWLPALSADIPLEVTARVDLLGIEEQEEAVGYIESRCGEPLTVAQVAFAPLSGAADLFGAGNVADVALEVLAEGSTVPDARFVLSASASQAPTTPTAFRMASYGERVPISYRFDIPEALLPLLSEVDDPQPICQVAYTVALEPS